MWCVDFLPMLKAGFAGRLTDASTAAVEFYIKKPAEITAGFPVFFSGS